MPSQLVSDRLWGLGGGIGILGGFLIGDEALVVKVQQETRLFQTRPRTPGKRLCELVRV
jgi:hypothetical protein